MFRCQWYLNMPFVRQGYQTLGEGCSVWETGSLRFVHLLTMSENPIVNHKIQLVREVFVKYLGVYIKYNIHHCYCNHFPPLFHISLSSPSHRFFKWAFFKWENDTSSRGLGITLLLLSSFSGSKWWKIDLWISN